MRKQGINASKSENKRLTLIFWQTDNKTGILNTAHACHEAEISLHTASHSDEKPCEVHDCSCKCLKTETPKTKKKTSSTPFLYKSEYV